MNPVQMGQRLVDLGWTNRELARRLGTHPTTVQRWAHGRQEIPAPVEEWLTNLARMVRKNPPPRRF